MPSWTNALDIGLKLTNMAAVSRFYLYVPGPVERSSVQDLAPVLRIGSTLNAVFNDVVTLGPETDTSYEVTVGGRESFTILFVTDHDILIEPFKQEENTVGSRIVFVEPFCRRINESRRGAVYIRVRIELLGPTADLFSSELVAGDRFFASTTGRLELTELRLNERRSYPQRILELTNRGDFRITAVHYFLIRDLQHRLVIQHAPFRKVRRLEHNLWAEYLAGDTSPARSQLGAKLASRLAIYHWREKAAEGKTLNGFIAFASFSASSASLFPYAAGIVLLGATGSALAAGVAVALEHVGPFERKASIYCATKPDCITEISNLTLVLLLLIALVVLITAIAPWSTRRSSARGRVRSGWVAIRRRWSTPSSTSASSDMPNSE